MISRGWRGPRIKERSYDDQSLNCIKDQRRSKASVTTGTVNDTKVDYEDLTRGSFQNIHACLTWSDLGEMTNP